MTVPLITVVFDPPEISDPANFETKADNLLNVDLPELTVEYNASITAFNAVVDDLDAKISLSGFGGTSTTSVAIGTGSKSFTTQTGLSYVQGSFIKVSYDATHWMWGEVLSYDGATGALVVTVQTVTGSGTYAAWSFSLAEPIGERVTMATTAEFLAGNSAKAASGATLYASAVPVALTYASTVNWDTNNGFNAYVILAGNPTIAAPTNVRSGVTYSLELVEDATGSRVPTFDTYFDWGNAGAPLLQTGAGKADKVFFQHNARTGKGDASFRRGA